VPKCCRNFGSKGRKKDLDEEEDGGGNGVLGGGGLKEEGGANSGGGGDGVKEKEGGSGQETSGGSREEDLLEDTRCPRCHYLVENCEICPPKIDPYAFFTNY
jgi:hypothetical protein